MTSAIRDFFAEEAGAVTVDWVVLTGSAVALALIMLTTMNGSASSVATEIETVLVDVDVVEVSNVGYAD